MFGKRIISSTLIFRKFPLEEALVSLKENDINDIEIVVDPEFCPHLDFFNITRNEIEKLGQMVEKVGVKIVALNIGLILPEPGDDLEQANTAHLNAFTLGKRLGAKLVTLSDGAVPPEDNHVERLREIAIYYQKMGKVARKDFGITLSVEAPHKNSIAERLDEVSMYFEFMGESIKCTLDLAHVIYSGATLKDAVKILGKRIAHVHLRDAVVGNSLLYPGEGDVDFASIFRLMKDIGYQGYFSLELPGNDNKEESDAILKRSMKYILNLEKQI